MSCVYAGSGNFTDDYIVNGTVPLAVDDKVYALEEGHFNTSFSDGSNGYCLEYGEQEARVGDEFVKVDTSKYNASKYIKTYFLRYYDYSMKDKIRTQHYIWHFTDGFDGWRLNYTIINDIKSNPLNVPDNGYYKLNSTHSLKYNFNVLLSLYEYHQDYFAFVIRLVNNSSIVIEDLFNESGNSSLLNESVFGEIVVDDVVDVYEFHSFIQEMSEGDGDVIQMQLNDKTTGNMVKLLAISLIILMVSILIISDKFKRS